MQRLLTGDVAGRARARAALPRHLRALRGRRRGPRLRAGASSSSSSQSLGGEEGADRGPRRGATPTRARGRRRRASGDPGVVVKGVDGRLGQARPLLHAGAGRRDRRLRHPRQRRLGAPRRLRQRRARCRRSPSAWSRSSGRRPRPRSSWSPSRSRRWTGPGCSPTSPGCCPTSTSTSCRRRSRPPATGSRRRRFTFEMGDPKHLGPRAAGRPRRRGRLRRLPRHQHHAGARPPPRGDHARLATHHGDHARPTASRP